MLRKLIVVGNLCLASTVAAQSGAPVDDAPVTPTVPQQTQRTEVVPPPPGPLARAAATVAENVRIYGILRPVVNYSSAAIESFSNPNASAPTAAANPAIATLPGDSRLSFQAAQTRFGLWIGEGTAVRGHLEFDFIDFSKSSPTVQSLIRLRIATVEYDPIDRLTLIAGQDWDLYAPINAHGVNLVGTHFQSGNTGFMRNQLKALYTLGSVELAGAIGMQGSNAAFRDASLELGRMPTFALRATALLGKLGRVGIDGIATRLRLSPGANERYTFAGSAGLFGELMPLSTLQVRFEAYVAQNLANLGALALSQASLAHDVGELGGFLSVREGFLERHAVYGSIGTAQTTNPGRVVPSYAYAASAGMPALGSATLAGTGPGMRWNDQARLGYDFKPIKALAIAVELFWFKTRHQLLAMDQPRAGNPTRKAFGTDVGMVYTF